MEQVKFIDGRDINIKNNGGNGLEVCYGDGYKKEGIRARRLFTVSNPYSYIQLVQGDKEEIGILKDASQLDTESRRVLQEALDKFYVIPKIIEIKKIYEEYGVSRWDVVTDRGPRSFDVQSRNTDIHILEDTRVLIRDADNNRYEISDYEKLSKESYKLLEGEI